MCVTSLCVCVHTAMYGVDAHTLLGAAELQPNGIIVTMASPVILQCSYAK